uniref:Cytochrome c biogenesis protein CcsA n=1 Tax=Polysiphonia scopulorum TaxID=257860 RepID=A0A1Z1MHJ2_9FLOR|nr:cytochrome c biogenesis protein ccs1 [Polysiphonia scopulorum]ARW65547.1 cytochrome c biogenesis protein ccs1 [Polysiphonia scopulorum]
MKVQLIENTLVNISFSLSLIGLVIYWSSLIIYSRQNKYLYNTISIGINLTLASTLIIRWFSNKYFPLSNLYESLIFLAWCITLIQIVIENKTKSNLLGTISMPVVLLIIAFTSISIPNELKVASPLIPALKSNWLIMHVTVMILSYATLIIGSLLSVLFLIISRDKSVDVQGNSNNSSKKILFEYEFKNQNQALEFTEKTNKINNINFIQAIDNLSYRIIGLGFPLLTIGIISGAVWANDAWGTYWSWDPKETWALITWIIFAIYLHSRLNNKKNTKTPALIGSVGFIVIWICYLGVNFLGKGLHSYGWLLS